MNLKFIHNLTSIKKDFDICIMDEATQCDELSGLLCLQFGISHLVLVGETPIIETITKVSVRCLNERCLVLIGSFDELLVRIFYWK